MLVLRILASFDVISFFTTVPIGEVLQLQSQHFNENILRLYRHALTSSFLSFNEQFYKQTDGVATDSPLSPVSTNFFMEHFEETAMKGTNHKPLC